LGREGDLRRKYLLREMQWKEKGGADKRRGRIEVGSKKQKIDYLSSIKIRVPPIETVSGNMSGSRTARFRGAKEADALVEYKRGRNPCSSWFAYLKWAESRAPCNGGKENRAEPFHEYLGVNQPAKRKIGLGSNRAGIDE